MEIIGVIPARWASSRLPGKPLADLCGKPVIQRVYEQCMKSRSLTRIIVATDDRRIFDAVKSFGGEVVMTSVDHPNGTSRVAEAVSSFSCDYVINIQGDEPMIDPRMIDQLAELIISSDCPMATLCSRFSNRGDAENPNNVKVVFDRNNRAVYFSRSLIPFPRKGDPDFYKHIGIYAYRSDFLPEYLALEMTPLCAAESLEQLKAIEHGYSIAIAESVYHDESVGIDTPEDLVRARKLLSETENKK